MEFKEAKSLIAKYKAGTCTSSEKELIESWYNHYASSIEDLTDDPDYLLLKELHWTRIQEQQQSRIGSYRYLSRIAAAIIIVLFASVYYYSTISNDGTISEQVVTDIPPGINKAVLTLANGTSIDLSSDKEGIIVGAGDIAYIDGTEVSEMKRGDSQIKEIGGDPVNLNDNYNTLTTPKGGSYQIVLPDGTKVWLNAASTLRYPNKFDENRREVELKGEAYFSVTKKQGAANEKKQFVVKTAGQEILVLGTEFNVLAYEDEKSLKTTLVTGSLLVHKTDFSNSIKVLSQPTVIKPGEETILSNGNLQKQKADINSTIGWKNGIFHFNDQIPFDVVMRQISRWYNIDVKYEDGIPNISFTGKMGRNVKLSTLIAFLKDSGIDCRLEEGRELIVSK